MFNALQGMVDKCRKAKQDVEPEIKSENICSSDNNSMII
jgi:hypothetical protein